MKVKNLEKKDTEISFLLKKYYSTFFLRFYLHLKQNVGWLQEKQKYPVFMVELAPLKCFWSAEEYHQDYLIKNPTGYCHVSLAQYAAVRELNNE